MSELRDSELRDLLERVAVIEGDIDVDEHWQAGRRRRFRRGAAIAVATGAVVVAGVGAVAQTALLGGSSTTPTGPAAVPDALETFVFAVPDAPGAPDRSAGVSTPTVGELAGTSWVLQDGMWNATTTAAELTGTTQETVLTFGEPGPQAAGGWGLEIDGCGGAWAQELVLDGQGRFADQVLSTHDIGCADDVQAAEDFWMESLSGGGQLTLVDDGRWLLLSVEAPARPAPVPTADPRPTTTAGPSPARPTDEDGTAAPGQEGTPAPVARPTTSPTAVASPTPTLASPPPAVTSPPPTAVEGNGTPAPPPAGQPFLAADQVSIDPPWPGGGGALYAPTVRAGVHEGFDRVVVDLTGTGELGWRAAYTDDPRLDGSGFASDIAGDSVLELSLAGMAYPDSGSDVYSEGVFGLDTHTLRAVVEVQRTAPFEGMLQVFVGMQGEPRPYRVFLLEEPMRLVIDVQTGP